MEPEIIDITVLPEDFEAAKDKRASIRYCLVATAIRRNHGGDVSVGVYTARIGSKQYEINPEGGQLIRDFVLHRDNLVLPILPVTIRLTQVGDDEDEEF